LVDHWRKELFDAARFAPERGRDLLWDWQRLAELPCHTGTLWVVASAEQLPRLAPLGATRVLTGRHALLLKRQGQDCVPGQPTQSSLPSRPSPVPR